MARQKYEVKLSDKDVQTIKNKLKKKDTTETIANRCRILMDVDRNHLPVMTQEKCAAEHRISRTTVSNTMKQYYEEGLQSVLELKRNVNSDNARRKVDGRAEARLIALACGPAPEGHSRWTIRLLEQEAKVVLDEPVSRETIRRTLKKTNFDLTAVTTGVFHPKKTRNS